MQIDALYKWKYKIYIYVHLVEDVIINADYMVWGSRRNTKLKLI